MWTRASPPHRPVLPTVAPSPTLRRRDPMFKELGQLTTLMKMLPKIKEEMDRYQQQLAQIIAEGDAGGGMVKVTVNGKMEVLSCSLTDEALKLNDREMLEELIRAATN